MPRYHKPPIVEAWLAFDFDPRPDKRSWEADVVSFRKRVSNDYPEAKFHYTTQIAVAEGHGNELPTVTERTNSLNLVRMWSEDKKRILQLADDRLAANTLRAGSDYGGFSSLRQEAFRRLGDYNAVYQPTLIRQTTIHLTDIVEVPVGKTAPEIEELFTIVRNLDTDPFGDTSDLLVQYTTLAPHDGGPLAFQLGRVPSGRPETLRFRLDWEKVATTACRLDDVESLEATLTADYQFLVRCFEASVTPRTLALFEPISLAQH